LGRWALRLALVGLVAVAAVAGATWRLSKSRHVQCFGGLVTRVQTSEPLVALTFDDGPLPGSTEEILGILDAAGARATFFVVGEQLAAYPEEARRIVAAGHELGNHTYSHRQMVGLPYAAVAAEIEETDALIRAAGYSGPIAVRPPYGKRLLTLPYYLWRHGRPTLYWDVEPESYGEIAGDSGRIAAYVLDQVQPGSVVLLHVMGDNRAATRAAVPAIIAGLYQRGYRLATVSELLAAAE
jgi:peptidoglycan/xylan/chitin deacetylase (PgdA/CDA1 family)